MKKVIFYLCILVLFVSCTEKPKFLVKNDNYWEFVTLQGEKVWFIFNGNELDSVIVHNGKIIEFLDVDENQKKINSIRRDFVDRGEFLNISYDMKSNLMKDQFWYSSFQREKINFKSMKDRDCFEFYYQLKGLKTKILTYYFDIAKNNDTLPDYKYYTLNSDGYTFNTDFDRFLKDCSDRDSMFIEYVTKCVKDVPFNEVDESVFLPDFTDFRTNKVYNTLHINGEKQNCFTGILWSFHNKKLSDTPFSYQRLNFNGDMIKRQRKFMVELEKLKNDYRSNEVKSNLKLMNLFKISGYTFHK